MRRQMWRQPQRKVNRSDQPEHASAENRATNGKPLPENLKDNNGFPIELDYNELRNSSSDDDDDEDECDNNSTSHGRDSRARRLERKSAKADEYARSAERMDERLRHDKAKTQREAFLFFLVKGATQGAPAPSSDPWSVYFSTLFQLASPLGLLGNMASIISICDHWRMDSAGRTITDVWWVLLLNSLALACGCVANLVLFLHAESWMRRSWSLIGVCLLYLTADCIYMAILGATQVVYFHRHTHALHKTSGYWHAVCASVLYFFSALSIVANLLYFRKKKWNASMSQHQRRIMTLSSLFIAWIAIGGATFQPHSMLSIPYSDAAYYCVVSCLTLGYGDITPSKVLPRALIIPYLYIGLVLAGLSTLSIFQASLASARSESIATHVDQRRYAALAEPIKSEEQSFNTMRTILRQSRERAVLSRTIITFSWLVIFWLIGALIFKYAEGWAYFDAFYYVAVSLATVGYGDFTPKSTGGRSFFVYWSMLAVPTMTTAVSDLSALTMQWAQSLRMLQEKMRTFGIVRAYRWYKQKRSLHASKYDVDEGAVNEVTERIESLASELPNRERWRAITRLTALPKDATFTLETWHTVVCEILGVNELPADFWLSNMSPIRIPSFSERQFILLAALNMLRLSMPETEAEVTVAQGMNNRDVSDTSSTVTNTGETETKPAA